jgi:ArsR family transcriptional regulator
MHNAEHCEGNCFLEGAVVKNHPLPSVDAYELAELFKIFADPTRIRILYALLEAERCVCEIADNLSMTPSAISHQLSLLKRSRLVKNRREGKTIYYSLADDHVRLIMDAGVEHIGE